MASTKKPQGFAAISPERRAEISRMGGIAAHEAGTAHEFTTEEARAAGKKGGEATHAKRQKTED
jgi:general stress protein YciG